MASFEFEYIKLSLNNNEIHSIFWALITEIKAVIGDKNFVENKSYFYDSRRTAMQLAENIGKRIGMENVYYDAVKQAENWVEKGELK